MDNTGQYLISIHPSLAGRDRLRRRFTPGLYISIHPSLAGRDPALLWPLNAAGYFNPPVPRGTGRDPLRRFHVSVEHFNPPVPRGTGPKPKKKRTFRKLFQSTRPSRDGTLQGTTHKGFEEFQSTRPSRDGTHTLHGDDHSLYDFNPPVPRGTGRLLQYAIA